MKILKEFPEPSIDKLGWPWTEETPVSLYKNREDWPKISIVTPSYNQGYYIEKTIRSILLQNYPNLEYIIIDGGSSDYTVDIIKKYGYWITYWTSEKDQGQSDAINKGLKKCTGILFNWLNSDDFYEPAALFNIASAYLNEKKPVIAGKSNILSLAGNWISSTPVGTDFYMFSKARIDQPATFFNLKVFRELGPVSLNQNLVMDAELWFKFLLKYDSTYITVTDHIIVNFQEHPSSKTVNNRYKIVLGRAKLYTQILNAFKGRKNQFTDFTVQCKEERILEIKKGINDFILYWLKNSIVSLKFHSFSKLLKFYLVK